MTWEEEHAELAEDFSVDEGATEVAFYDRLPEPLATQSVTMMAYQVKPARRRYEELGLVPQNAITLAARPNTYGEQPPQGYWCIWQGRRWKVRFVDQTAAPDGNLIIGHIHLER